MRTCLTKGDRWRYRRNFWMVIGLLLTIWMLGETLRRFLELFYLPFSE